MKTKQHAIARVRQSGIAIVLAMGIVTLAALTATAILVSQSTWARQVELNSGRAQAQLVIQAGLDWARAVLSDDRRASNSDHLGEPWALRLAPIPIDNGSLSGQLDDEQGKFNLNNLVNQGKLNIAQLERFRRLLAALTLPVSLADALADWIDADHELQPRYGAEDAYYLSMQPPYLAANQPLVEVTELSLVRGYDEAVRSRLRPFVTALPRTTTINENTASAEVLSAGIEGLDLDMARSIVAQRGRAHFRNLSDFTSLLPRGIKASPQEIGVSSDYFLASMRVAIGDVQAQGAALLARDNPGWPTVVWRKIP